MKKKRIEKREDLDQILMREFEIDQIRMTRRYLKRQIYIDKEI